MWGGGALAEAPEVRATGIARSGGRERVLEGGADVEAVAGIGREAEAAQGHVEGAIMRNNSRQAFDSNLY